MEKIVSKKKKKIKKRNIKKKKKRVGRPRKRGPKTNYYKKYKKKKIPKKTPGRKKLSSFKYKIISCRNCLQNKIIGKYRNIEDAYEEFNRLKEEDKNVLFPSNIMGLGALENAIDEYLLIEKRENGDDEIVKLRNEYGKLVEQKTNLDDWYIIDKFRYKKEETFWVFGYNQHSERKTFKWIYDNLVINDIDNYFSFKRIILYKNKIVIKDDNNNIDLILCKHPNDSIRFYNKLEEMIKKDKIKQVIFSGDYSYNSDRRKKLVDELVEFTGWKKSRVGMKTNSYNKSNKKE